MWVPLLRVPFLVPLQPLSFSLTCGRIAHCLWAWFYSRFLPFNWESLKLWVCQRPDCNRWWIKLKWIELEQPVTLTRIGLLKGKWIEGGLIEVGHNKKTRLSTCVIKIGNLFNVFLWGLARDNMSCSSSFPVKTTGEIVHIVMHVMISAKTTGHGGWKRGSNYAAAHTQGSRLVPELWY